MRRRSRTRRVLKWVGMMLCAIIAAAWGLSAPYVLHVQPPDVRSGWRLHVTNGVINLFILSKADVRRGLQAEQMFRQEFKRLRRQLAEYEQRQPSSFRQESALKMREGLQEAESKRSGPRRLFAIYRSPSWDFYWIPLWQRQGSGGTFVSIPIWMPFALVALPTTLLWWLDRRRYPRGHCQRCGYDLRGLPELRCPVCGTAFVRAGDATCGAVHEFGGWGCGWGWQRAPCYSVVGSGPFGPCSAT